MASMSTGTLSTRETMERAAKVMPPELKHTVSIDRGTITMGIYSWGKTDEERLEILSDLADEFMFVADEPGGDDVVWHLKITSYYELDDETAVTDKKKRGGEALLECEADAVKYSLRAALNDAMFLLGAPPYVEPEETDKVEDDIAMNI